MKLRHLLQGRAFGHPIHPLLIHFPIAAFTLSFLCDVVAMLSSPTGLAAQISSYLILIGLFTGALAALTGLADYTSIRRDSRAKRIATEHAMLNAVVMGIYAFSFLIRYNEGQISIVSFIFSSVAITVLMYSGYLGGHLVYNEGIAVGRHRRETELPLETITVEEHNREYATLFEADQLGEGETRRARVNGTTLVVARHGGELFSFQEFCTHRQGPLSAGTLENGEVMCPWHRSCFDMRTGAVKHGPAKEPIKVFAVRVSSEGMIEVKVG